MWVVGICKRCGTVTACKSTESAVRLLSAGRTLYCPVCWEGQVKNIAWASAETLETVYNNLQVQNLATGGGSCNGSPTTQNKSKGS